MAVFPAVTACIVALSSIAEGRFLAVSSLVGSEQFYIAPWFIFYDDLSPTMKKEICRDLIESPLFDTLYQVDSVDPTDEEVFVNLKENYPKIYEDLFEQQNSSTEVVFKNPYRKRDIVVGKNVVHESMFTCLAMRRGSKVIVEYYVSQAHLVNYPSHKHIEDRMKGLFVFAYDDKEQLSVIALAEEPGYIIAPSDHAFNESFMSGFDHEMGSHYDEHQKIQKTLCGINVYQKVRLCTLLLNVEEYRKEVTFYPHEDNVDPQCYRGVIKFRNFTDSIKREQNDWMIGCKAINVESKKTETFYVSAGFHSLDYFICHEPGKEKTILGGISCRIEVQKRAWFPSLYNSDEAYHSYELENS